MTRNPLLRRRWVPLLTAVVLIACVTTATAWLAQDRAHPAASGDDCAVVEALADQWSALVASSNAATGTAVESGDTGVPLAVADQETAISDKLRAAADSVSTPGFKEALTKWADGAALGAGIQRDAVNHPSQVPPDVEVQLGNAVRMVDQAAGVLAEGCPNVGQVLRGE